MSKKYKPLNTSLLAYRKMEASGQLRRSQLDVMWFVHLKGPTSQGDYNRSRRAGNTTGTRHIELVRLGIFEIIGDKRSPETGNMEHIYWFTQKYLDQKLVLPEIYYTIGGKKFKTPTRKVKHATQTKATSRTR